MLSNKEIKDIQSLGEKKFRNEQRLFIAEGPKIVTELLQEVPLQVVKVYATQAWAFEKVGAVMPQIQLITPAELERISQLQTPNQVLAVVKQFETKEPFIKNSFCIYLDTVQDPGNVGTIIRISDWFGISHIVCNTGCADVYNSKVVQASMASIARVGIYYDKEGTWLQKQTAPVYAATLEGKPLQTFSKAHTGILIIGNESRGISEALLQTATHKITIPRKGAAESLNASVAAGIIAAHLLS